jgi:hypothetical protein
VTQKYKNARSDEYATRSDFCRIYIEQMNSLYLLSLLLTSDPGKAEQCFLLGFDESVGNHSVFRERAYLWARRSIILQAIRLLRPRPIEENEVNEAKLSASNEKVPAGTRPYANYARMARLSSFERFIFIMSILEKYSDQECSLFLGCRRRDVINARTAAIRHLADGVRRPVLNPIMGATAEGAGVPLLQQSPAISSYGYACGGRAARRATFTSPPGDARRYFWPHLTVKSSVAQAGL